MTVHTESPPWVLSLQPYVPGKPIEELERELGIRGSIKLASNENPLGVSPLAAAAAHDAMARVHLYPDAATWRLRERLAAFADVPMARILTGNGSDELLHLLVRAFATNSHNAVMGEYGFIAYRVATGAAGLQQRAVPMPGFEHDLGAMARACDANTRLLLLANPNNPTGTWCGRAAVEALLRDTPEHVLIVLDEAYVEFADDPDYPNGLSLLGLRENLVVLRTFSKAYGMAGLRVGWAVVPEYVADRINRIRLPFNVNIPAQEAAIAALDDTDFVERTVALTRRGRAVVSAGLDALGLEYIAGQANFVLVRSPVGGPELYQRLLRQGVIVRPLQPYRMLDHVRISLGTDAENERMLGALGRVLRDVT